VIDVYGIPACSTVKKARAWLDARAVAHRFVDFKKTPPSQAQLAGWCRDFGWEQVLNRRGTTWRTMSAQEQAAVRDERSAIAAMLARPSLIKRPIVEAGRRRLLGFDEAEYQKALG
jgi:Spx/MgsR family transcriptional regulator